MEKVRSMELNNCFNSPTCTSMTEHLVGIGSPAEGLSLAEDVVVIAFRVSTAGSSSPSLFDLISRLSPRSEEHTSELQSHLNLVCRLLLEKKKAIEPSLYKICHTRALHLQEQ